MRPAPRLVPAKTRNWLATAMFLCLPTFQGCAPTEPSLPAATAAQDEHVWTPAKTDDGWDVGAASQAGFDTSRLDSMTAALRQGKRYPNVHAVLIARNGKLVYESYFTGEDLRWDGERFDTFV